MKKNSLKILLITILSAFSMTALGAMESSNYKIPFDSLNVGGNEGDSVSYGLSDVVGQLASGESESPGYRLRAGFFTDLPPVLIFNIIDNSVVLGALSVSQVSTAFSAFSVATNADSGYSVTISGNTLTHSNETDIIDAMTDPTSSNPGNEQFGINLVDNSDPDVGANPSGGSGQVGPGYNTANNFKFVSGNTIAFASAYSAITTFTISYIANIAPTTDAGTYSTTITLVATGTF